MISNIVTGTNFHTYGVDVNGKMTVEEALSAGGLNFRVAKQPISVLGKLTDFYATVRMDTKDTMGIVKSGYKIIQNDEAFDFFNTVVGSGEASIERVGTLGKYQEKSFMLAHLPDQDYTIGGVDVHKSFLIITNDHSGNGTCLALPTDVRLSCWNQMNYLMYEAKREMVPMVKIRHSGDVQAKFREATMVMEVAKKASEVSKETNIKLISKQVSIELASKMFDTLLNIKVEFGKEAEEINSTVKLNQKEALLKLFVDGKGADMFPNTAYNYLNAVTEYYDHHKSIRGKDRLSTVFVGGNGFRQKVEAEKQLMEFIKS